jgi:hypothetical protein
MVGVMADYLNRLRAEATCDPAIIAAVQVHIFRTRVWQEQHPPKDPDMNVDDIVRRDKLK